MVRGALNSTRSFTEATVYQAVMSAVSAEIPTTSGAFRPVNVVTKPGTIAHVVMPAASTMRGVTGFRIFDAVNGALAQLIPHRVPAAGEGGNTLAIFAGDDAEGERFIYFELVAGTWGARPDRGRQRRSLQPGRDRREHPGRGRRGGLPDHGRELRPRRRQRRPRALSRRARDRARPGGRSSTGRRCRSAPTASAMRPTASTAASRAALGQRADERRRADGLPADVLDRGRRGHRLPPPHGGRRRLGRSARAPSRARRAATSPTTR